MSDGFRLWSAPLAAALLVSMPAVASAAPTAKASKTKSSVGAKARPTPKKSSAAKPSPKAGAKPSAKPSANKAAVTKRRGASKVRRAARARVRPSATATRSTKALKPAIPKGAALVSAALLNYVDGKRSSAVDKRIAKALDALPGGRAAAGRIAGRIRAQSTTTKKRIIGPNANLLGGPTSTKSLESTTSGAVARGFTKDYGYLSPLAQTLTPESVTIPSEIDVRVAGLRADAVTDADGTDELVVVTKFGHVSNTSQIEYTMESASPDGFAVSAGRASPLSGVVKLSGCASCRHVFVSAIAPTGSNAATTRGELEVAIELARALASDTGGPDVTQGFIAALAYTEGMLTLSRPDFAPSLRAQVVRGADVQSWWSAPPETVDSVEWKAQAGHTRGAGQYAVLLDAPSEAPEFRMVGVVASRVKSLGQAVASGQSIRIEAKIRDRSADKTMYRSDGNPFLHVRRQVLPGNVRIELEATWQSAPKPFDRWSESTGGLASRRRYFYCGNPPAHWNSWIAVRNARNAGPCEPETKALDLTPGSGSTLILSYDPRTDTVFHGRGAVQPGQDGFVRFTGNGEDHAEITLRVYDRAP